MKTEAELIADLNNIVSKYISNFTTTVISRKSATVSSLDTTVALIFQDESITHNLLVDILDYVAQNDRNSLALETKKDLGNLDFEVILINAEIFYI